MIYKKIKRWPIHHERNVMIAYKYLKFGSKSTSSEYGIGAFRVTTIFRVLMAQLWSQKLEIAYKDVPYNKKMYGNLVEEALEMISDYYFSIFDKNIDTL